MNPNLNKITRALHPLTRAALALTIGLILSQARASIGTLDQFNSVGSSISLGTMTPGQSLGQSFKPFLLGIDLFDIQALSLGSSTMRVRLFTGQTIVGVPIASSAIRTITNTAMETIEFQFPSTVSLIPGNDYTASIDLISGDSYKLQFSNANPYTPGVAISEFGQLVLGADLVFAEGLISSVPEPSSAVLAGAAVLLLLSRHTIPRRAP